MSAEQLSALVADAAPLPLYGLLIGVALGALVQRSRFCIMGAIADIAISDDWRRSRMWLVAAASAAALTQLAVVLDLAHVNGSHYLDPQQPLLSLLIGGWLFGIGMVFCCGCPSRALVNVAGGDMRALVALLVMAVSASIALNGALAPTVEALDATSQVALVPDESGTPALDGWLFAASGVPLDVVKLGLALLLLGYVARAVLLQFREGDQERNGYLLGAGAIGALVALSWTVTSAVARDPFATSGEQGLSFVAPVASSLLHLMLASRLQPTFDHGLIAGVLLGAGVTAMMAREISIRAFDDGRELGRYLGGGTLMGVGGVLAAGCSVGQGLSGIATLSVGSALAVAGLVAGVISGVRWIESGGVRVWLRSPRHRRGRRGGSPG